MADKEGTLARDASRRVALVTGASRGIGRAVACGLAADGFDLALVYAGNADAAADAVAACEAAGATARAYRCDVSNADEVKATADAVLIDFGSVWALVNNAGITRDTLLARMKDEDFARVLEVNLTGAFNMMRALTRPLMRQRGGRIVSMSSVVGLMGNAGQANYAASKAGLIGLTKALAKEEGPSGITVNCVAPGVIDTEMNGNLPQDVKDELAEETPLERLGTPEDVAQAVWFLASPAGDFFTGQVLAPNGGLII